MNKKIFNFFLPQKYDEETQKHDLSKKKEITRKLFFLSIRLNKKIEIKYETLWVSKETFFSLSF